MDYLRTLGSAAVSSLVQKSGLNLPFTLGQKVTSFEGTSNVWTLYDATKRDDGSPISVFEFKGDYRNDLNLRALAKNALHKLRATRHPDVLKFVGEAWSSKSAQEKQDWLLWGLHRITTALAFVNDPCNSTHGSIRVGSIFVTPTGEWKLGGFEVLTSPRDVSGVLYTYANRQPEADAIAAPEVKKAGWSSLKENPVAAVDSYALALLIHTLFNPAAGSPPTTQPPHNPPQPSSRGAIPQSVFPSFKKLLNPNPKPRMTAKTFLELGMSESAADGGFFKSNRLLQICEGLEGFSLMSEGERAGLLRTLKDVAPTLPGPFATQLILPSLLAALSHPATTTSAPAILPLAIQLGKNVPSDDHLKVVIEPVIKLFASPDRVTRMALLDMLPDYAGALDKKTVTDKVWPHLQTGFTDTVPVIREATIKAIGLLSDKFSERILNNELLRHLARLQSDPEASIRTNTCILIGRLGPTFGYNTKRKVLVMAFAKALKDDSVHARVAGLMAFMACMGCFEVEELAGKVVGVVAGALVDKEKIVRDQAFKAVELFMKRLETHAATMPETVLDDDKSINLASFTSPTANGQTTLASSAAGAAGALAGWAISSIGKATQTKYGQCGGQGWTGPTVCASGSTCQTSNAYYSQCL
ncbi:hypothetical protein EWM64_g2211 [Hericium alpestre]|uniref:CBM1 domain-containing protein n=1 Tax=Hericium alpestre TaxID=135208 RepID=A0A4Z0A440_9AGAM|nr:hypothetical protein EWM64_g2211 [Hericium alpestre]